MKILFWNTNKRKGMEKLVCDLICENSVDILIVAESELDGIKMLVELNRIGADLYDRTDYLSQKIEIYSHYRKEYFELIYDDNNITARNLVMPDKESILVIGAHFPSKLYTQGEIERLSICIDISDKVKELQKKVRHKRTVITGDFNMNPFESGMTNAKGLHSTMDKRIASKKYRIVNGKRYEWFYNPMWGKLGDCDGEPPGTFFFQK